MNDVAHKGGRIPANFRQANIAEGVAMQMIRPFAAIAPVPREEDHGVDVIGTLLNKVGRSLVAEDSFFAQIKTHTAASFEFSGDGVRWLRQMQIPYFPIVINLDTVTASLYTLNKWQKLFYISEVSRYVFCTDPDGLDDFPLGEPLMEWSIGECVHVDFRDWAYSILKPAIKIERSNQRFGPMSRFFSLNGGPYYFRDRGPDGKAINPPSAGEAWQWTADNAQEIFDALRNTIAPFVHLVVEGPWDESRHDNLLKLRDSLKGLGLDPDDENKWERMSREVLEIIES